jgi:putative membrane protein
VPKLADSPPDLPPPLAQFRTDLSEDRTVLANERTFASWTRTGFAGIGIGLAFNVLFTRVQPEWVPRVIATIFLGIAIFIFVAAERRACAVLHRLHVHRVATIKIIYIRVITIASVAATLCLVAVLWLLEQPLY